MSRDLGRLKSIQHRMVDILDVVDPGGVWYPLVKRQRIGQLKDDPSLAQRVQGMIPQVIFGTLGAVFVAFSVLWFVHQVLYKRLGVHETYNFYRDAVWPERDGMATMTE